MLRNLYISLIIVLLASQHSTASAFFTSLKGLSSEETTVKFGEVFTSSMEKAEKDDIATGKKDLLNALEKYKRRTDLLISYCSYLQIIGEFNEVRACTDEAFEKLKLITQRKTPDGKNLSADKEFLSDSDILSSHKLMERTGLKIPDTKLLHEVQSLVHARLSIGDLKGARELLEFAKSLHFSTKEISEIYSVFVIYALDYGVSKEELTKIWEDYQKVYQAANVGPKDNIAYMEELLYLTRQQDTEGLKRLIFELEAMDGADVLRLSIYHNIDQQFTSWMPNGGPGYEEVRKSYEASRKVIHQFDGLKTKFFYLADAYSALGEHKKAFDYSLKALVQARGLEDQDSTIKKRAIEVVGQSNSPEDTGSGLSYNAVKPALSRSARYALLAGDIKAARSFFAESTLENTPRDYLAENAEFEGKLLVAEGKTKEAIGHYKSLIETFEIRRQHIALEAAKIQFSEGPQNLYDELIQLLVETGDFKAAFEYADRAKSRALLDLIQQRGLSAKLLSGDFPLSTIKLLEDLRTAEYKIRSIHLRDDTIVGSSAVDGYREVVQKISEQSPRIADLLRARYATAAEAQSALASNTVLVLFYGTKTQLYAFVVDKNAVKAIPLKASGLVNVERYRRALQNPQDKGARALGAALHKDLIAPLGLKAGADLIIIPHGQLHYLPFAALSDGAGRILAQSHTLRVLPSASLLLEQRNSKSVSPADSKILVVGNPDLGERSYDLPGAEVEATSISALFSGRSTLLLNQEAKKSSALQHFKTNNILHFALHGIFDPLDPLASGLAFAADSPTPGQPLKGLLSVEELYGLQTDASLVVLSACDTGLGAIRGGDEVVGLNRALFFSGARNVISSLWAVDDEATTFLMTKFYNQLVKSPPHVALQRAKLETQKKYPAPYYWAAFVLAGS